MNSNTKNGKPSAFALSAIAVGLLAPVADAATVSFGSLSELTGPDDLDLTGSIVFAIDVGGPGGTIGGVVFSQDNNPYSPATTGANNELGVGSWESPSTPGYYPGLNSPGNWNTSFSGDAGLDAVMSYGRNDSGTRRVSQLDVVPGITYKVQILGKSVGTESREFDLSVGFGNPAIDLADNSALDAWHVANLAVDNLQQSTPQLWTHTLTATTDKLWIGAANANSFGDGTGGDPNPIINAIVVTQIPEPGAPILAAFGLLGILCRRSRQR